MPLISRSNSWKKPKIRKNLHPHLPSVQLSPKLIGHLQQSGIEVTPLTSSHRAILLIKSSTTKFSTVGYWIRDLTSISAIIQVDSKRLMIPRPTITSYQDLLPTQSKHTGLSTSSSTHPGAWLRKSRSATSPSFRDFSQIWSHLAEQKK